MTISCIDPGTVCRQQTSIRTFSLIHKDKPGIYYSIFLITVFGMTTMSPKTLKQITLLMFE